jgi:hypothetical protein
MEADVAVARLKWWRRWGHRGHAKTFNGNCELNVSGTARCNQQNRLAGVLWYNAFEARQTLWLSAGRPAT